MTTVHRPGPLKQVPKAHKTGSHRSKGAVERDLRGRTKLKGPAALRRALRNGSKGDRRQQAVLLRKGKLREAIAARRASAGGVAAPTLVTVIVLGGSATAAEFVATLATCDADVARTQGHNVVYLAVPRFKARLGFLTPDITQLEDVLDSIKVSDAVCFVWPLEAQLSTWSELLLSTVLAHGVPSYVNVVPGLGAIQSGKQKEVARKSVEKLIDKWSLSQPKLLHADSVGDGVIVLRSLTEMKKKKMVLQQRHGHVLVEKLEAADEKDGVCTLLASGYVRGPFINVNRLVHLPGWGDFQLEKITQSLDDPHPIKQRHGMFEPRVLAEADAAKQESLQNEVVPDPLDAEQTWPDEHDELLDENKLAADGERRRVPRGTSSYQAAWILEDGEEGDKQEGEGDNDDEDMEDDDEDDDEDEDEEEGPEGLEAAPVEDEDMDEMNADTATEAPDGIEDDMEEDEEVNVHEVEQYRRERENARFPDEIDTPLDMPARVRFQKYRGLKSFRTSPWDALENLPYDYARIFKFANFKRTRKLMRAAAEDALAEGVVDAGVYATLHIKNVPTSFIQDCRPSSPLIIYSLLPHEQKMSVQNLVIKKHPSCIVPIASKSRLVFHVGFRRFEAQPIFSQHTNGDKFKMERYLSPDGPCVASVFAPITFAPASVLVFRIDAKGRQELVASGCVLDNNPDRVVLKRLVLSGHPCKINRRSVVTRYMFFNKEDIEWFKPVELYTPSGRRGHIKESLGTHGHMKCRFDQQLNAQDSVMMSLYKRVYPKWTYNPRVSPAERSRLAQFV